MKEEPKTTRGGILKRHVGYVGLFVCFTVVAFCIMFIVGMTSNIPHPLGRMLVFGFLYAIGWGLAITLFIAFMYWVCCWRNFKRFLFGLACLITLIALVYAEEDVRGHHEWNSYQSALEAQGEKLDFSDYVPPPVPDDQNFAMSPVWIATIKDNFQKDPEKAEAWYGSRINDDDVAKFLPLLPCNVSAITGSNWVNQWNYPATPNMNKNWALAGLIDLKPWQQYYRSLEITNPLAQIPITAQPQSPAADVLLALGKYDPLIEQLRQDSQRPDSRFPIIYTQDDPASILLPHLAKVKQIALVLQLRAIAELQNNQSDRAFDDFKLTLRLADSIKVEPFAIDQLVRMSIVQIAAQILYEGLAQHQWSDAQLAEMDSELAKPDFLADCVNSIRCEDVMHVKTLAWLEQKRNRVRDFLSMIQGGSGQISDADARLTAIGFYLMPKGWFYRSDIVMARATETWMSEGAVDDANQIVSPSKTAQASDKVNQLLRGESPINGIARMLVPEWKKFAQRTAYAQETTGLARTAIALERYRLAHGPFPDSLDALAPQFMPAAPHDIINGEPLHYRRTDDGQFVLYSVGWNETDDGGVAVAGHGPDSSVNMEQGDWVWKYPAK